jgi:hypothetical protein
MNIEKNFVIYTEQLMLLRFRNQRGYDELPCGYNEVNKESEGSTEFGGKTS